MIVDQLDLRTPQGEDLLRPEFDEEPIAIGLERPYRRGGKGADAAPRVRRVEGDARVRKAQQDVASSERVEQLVGGILRQQLAEKGGVEGRDWGGEEYRGEHDVVRGRKQVSVQKDGCQIKVLCGAKRVVVARDQVEGLGFSSVVAEDELGVRVADKSVADAVEEQDRLLAAPRGLHRVDLEDVKVGLLLDGAADHAQPQLDEQLDAQHLAAADGLRHGVGDEVDGEVLQVGKRGIEDEAGDVGGVQRGVEDGGDRAHAAAPQADRRGASCLLDVADDDGEVVLLVVSQGDVLSLG